MLMLLSPAKTQNFSAILPIAHYTQPEFQHDISCLIKVLKKYSASQLEKLMAISPKLAQLNYARFQAFDPQHFTPENSKLAIYVFEGDAYRSLAVDKFSAKQITYLQNHLLILSGLYGFLRPLDLMQAYRLEMHIPLSVDNYRNLYEFWGDKITDGINRHIQAHHHKFVINLASEEYFKAVHPEKLQAPLINIQFKEKHGTTYKTIGINAKKARGMMVRFIAQNQINTIADLKEFNWDNYTFSANFSSENTLCFIRN